jgi:trehalose 6-phosphate synthase
VQLKGGSVHVGLYPLHGGSAQGGDLVLLHDMSYIERRSLDTRRYLIAFMVGLGLAIAFITMAVAQLSWRGWVSGVRAIMRGEGLVRPLLLAPAPELAPFAAELRARLRDLEDEYRRAQGPEIEWNPERLRILLRTHLRGDQVIVVSNREPYIHERSENGIVVKRPASGLVTAVEPVMRACSGTWIAHGSGSADRQAVDRYDRVRVLPRRSRATTTASPTRACGRCATWPTCVRCSASPTGSITGQSMSVSPMPWLLKRTWRTRWCWCRTTTLHCCRT